MVVVGDGFEPARSSSIAVAEAALVLPSVSLYPLPFSLSSKFQNKIPVCSSLITEGKEDNLFGSFKVENFIFF